MSGSTRTLCVLAVGFGFAGSALAAMDSAQSTSGRNAAPARLSQKLHDDLTKAGFSEIAIMPSTVVVRARDSQGTPVMLVVNPDTLAEATGRAAQHKDPPLSGAIKGAPNSPIPAPPPKP